MDKILQQKITVGKKRTAKKAIIGFSVFVLLAIIGFLFWLFTGEITNAKKQIFISSPLPIMLVQNRPVYGNEFFQRLALAEKFNVQNKSEKNLIMEVKNRLIYEHKVKRLAASLKVPVSQNQINKAYDTYKQAVLQTSGITVEESLEEKGINQNYFKEEILSFEQLNSNLAIWFNGQRNLNEKTYRTADFLMQEVNSSSTFADIASLYSQDEDSKQFEGDLGFVELYNLLPELQEKIDAAASGEILLLQSSLGLHIIKIEGKNVLEGSGTPKVHLRQIFIKTSNFNSWLETQIQNYKVTSLINF